nr:cytochrome c3 family protein [Desulfuromonadales bacterium]NIS43125.1 cytochrome c3 family protein [Desulfuromonadales bacterium]
SGAKGVEGESSLMYSVGIGCQDCHTAVAKGIYRSTKETCADCHDEDYIGVFEEWAADTDAEIAKLSELRVDVEAALLDADQNNRDTAALWERYQKALYNLQFVEDDGTSGVHNNDYAISILDSVEEDFKAIMDELDSTW